MSTTHEKERTLTTQIEREVGTALPGVEVLAVELAGPARFTVFVDHAKGVDHALCARVTDVLRDYLSDYAIDEDGEASGAGELDREHLDARQGSPDLTFDLSRQCPLLVVRCAHCVP